VVQHEEGYTDAEIAQYIPGAVIAVSDVIAADTTSRKRLGGRRSQMKNMARGPVGGVKALGVGTMPSRRPPSPTR
jgi:hypothetical protein